jgi:hypothetical protein
MCMHFRRLFSSCLIAAALVGAPLVVAAEPAPIAAETTPARTPKSAVAADAERYAALETKSAAAAKFEGGGQGVYIGGGALTIVLVILLLVIIL